MVSHDADERGRRIKQLNLVADRLSELVLEKEHAAGEVRERLEETEAELREAKLALAAAIREADKAVIDASEQHRRAEEAALDAIRTRSELEELKAKAEKGADFTLDEELLALDESDEEIGAFAEPEPEPVVSGWAGQESEGNGASSGAGVYEGVVSVEVGPFSDFSQLVRFEDAAKSIAGAADISVKRFSKGRATLEVRLTDPVELLIELGERAPFEFSVRAQDAAGVVLDVQA